MADAGRLRVSSSASTSTAAKNTVGQQILINEQGKCSVQTGAGPNSDSTLNTVDLVKMQCDCGLYDKGNVCTHIVSAYTKAQKCIDIAQLRADMARDIVAKKQYHVDGDFITVHPSDLSATFVNLLVTLAFVPVLSIVTVKSVCAYMLLTACKPPTIHILHVPLHVPLLEAKICLCQQMSMLKFNFSLC